MGMEGTDVEFEARIPETGEVVPFRLSDLHGWDDGGVFALLDRGKPNAERREAWIVDPSRFGLGDGYYEPGAISVEILSAKLVPLDPRPEPDPGNGDF